MEILKKNPSWFKDRRIYLTIFREFADKEASEKFETLKEKYYQIFHSKELDFYQDWESLPKDAYLIRIHYWPQRWDYFQGDT